MLGAYSALSRQISTGQVKMHTAPEMLDLVVVDGHAKGIITRNLATGEIKAWTADAVYFVPVVMEMFTIFRQMQSVVM